MNNPIRDEKRSDGIIRGGELDSIPRDVRILDRYFDDQWFQYANLGFRIVRNKQ